jgi:hypothetical protein
MDKDEGYKVSEENWGFWFIVSTTHFTNFDTPPNSLKDPKVGPKVKH